MDGLLETLIQLGIALEHAGVYAGCLRSWWSPKQDKLFSCKLQHPCFNAFETLTGKGARKTASTNRSHGTVHGRDGNTRGALACVVYDPWRRGMQTSMTHSASPDNFKCNARTGDSELRDSLHDLIHERSEHVRLEASRGIPSISERNGILLRR